MVVFNYSGAEINAKIVYYGPGLSGKTTNLEYIYSKMPARVKGKMISMKTRTDRTLFFDFLPLELGDISRFKTRFLLYTVPGQVYYDATRKLVLKGADAVVFVADSSRAKLEENIDSLRNLEENLNEHGLSLDTIPWVIQYNKRDLEDSMPVEELDNKLNLLAVPRFEAIATRGAGVYETFQAIASKLYKTVKERVEAEGEEANGAGERQAPPQGPAAEAPEGGSASVSDVVEVALREVKHGVEGYSGKKVPVEEARRPGKLEPAGGQKQEVLAPQLDALQDDTHHACEEIAVPSAGEDFRFASLKEVDIDSDVGRVVRFDELSDSSVPQSEEGEFITDPCRPGPPPTGDEGTGEEFGEKERPPATDVQGSAAEELTVRIPVVISPSQVRKNVPLKLVLEIRVLDDED